MYNVCVGIDMYTALTYDVMKSYFIVHETRKFVITILHWRQGLLCDKNRVHMQVATLFCEPFFGEILSQNGLNPLQCNEDF